MDKRFSASILKNDVFKCLMVLILKVGLVQPDGYELKEGDVEMKEVRAIMLI